MMSGTLPVTVGFVRAIYGSIPCVPSRLLAKFSRFGVREQRNERQVVRGRKGLEQSSTSRQTIASARQHHTRQAYDFIDHLIAAKDNVTGLLPLHVKTEGGQLMATDHVASGLDMGRTTAGLLMLSHVAQAEGDTDRATRYMEAGKANHEKGKELLSHGDYFLHQRDYDDEGNPTTSVVGEPGKNAHDEDNMSRVNPRAYAFRAAAELYRATGKEMYRTDFERYFGAWVRDFHDPAYGGFFIHANVTDPSDHKEIASFKDPGGADSSYDGRLGVKGNDGTIYALAAVLLQANEVLGNDQTQGLVKEQIDLILNKFHRRSGMLWENYTHDWMPISVGWQSQLLDAYEGQAPNTSHVAIGGHTAMAPQQIIEGARQLLAQRRISDGEYRLYITRSLELFQEFVADSGAVDWNAGAVHNGIRVEESRPEHRLMRPWSDAGWQQAELIQTLVRIEEEGCLKDIQGPSGKSGEDLLRLAEQHYIENYPVPTNYSFGEFGNPDVYHRPQLALYHCR